MASKKELLNLIAIIVLISSVLLLVIILGGVTNYSDEVKTIWYWVIGIISAAGIAYLILIKE